MNVNDVHVKNGKMGVEESSTPIAIKEFSVWTPRNPENLINKDVITHESKKIVNNKLFTFFHFLDKVNRSLHISFSHIWFILNLLLFG